MKLTADNYYSRIANYTYCSVSQYKDFCGTYGKKGCEKTALAKIAGRYEPKKSIALLVGGYVDAYFEGTLEEYKMNNPEVFKKDGTLKADYIKAEKIIERVTSDKVFMKYMSGQKQVIMTADLWGVPFKIKMDSYLPGQAIVDLKIIESITKPKWTGDAAPMDFIEYWGYDIQGAVYQKVVEINTGKKLPFFIAAATKEDATNLEVIRVPQTKLDAVMATVHANLPRIQRLKNMEEAPTQCDTCEYCRMTKVLTGPIWEHEIQFDFG